MPLPAPFIHPTAIVEGGVKIGDGTEVWDNVHVRGPSSIGERCIIGGKSYVSYDVIIEDFCKLNSFVYVCAGVHIEKGVMISAGAVFANDRYPRAANPALTAALPSGPPAQMPRTRVGRGATIGASAVVGPGLEIGHFAMIGMGAVVTRPVGAFHLVVGNPAKTVGFVCRCGHSTGRFEGDFRLEAGERVCPACATRYSILDGLVTVADNS